MLPILLLVGFAAEGQIILQGAGGGRTIPEIRSLTDPDPEIRKQAIAFAAQRTQSFPTWRPPEYLPVFTKLLADEDEQIAALAGQCVARYGNEGEKILLSLLNRDGPIPSGAVAGLADIVAKTIPYVPIPLRLIPGTRTAKNGAFLEDLRAYARSKHRELPKGTLAALVKASDAKQPVRVRESAAWALRYYCPTPEELPADLLPRLVALQHECSENAYYSVSELLVRIGPAVYPHLLKDLAENPDDDCKKRSLDSVYQMIVQGQLLPKEGIAVLQKVMQSPNETSMLKARTVLRRNETMAQFK